MKKLVLTMVLAAGLGSTMVAGAAELKGWRTGTGNVIQQAGAQYFEAGRANILEPAMLKANLADGNPLNNPLLLDVRFEEDYAMGKIPGAIRIADFDKMLTEENLDKLDQALADHIAATGNDKVVVYSGRKLLTGGCAASLWIRRGREEGCRGKVPWWPTLQLWRSPHTFARCATACRHPCLSSAALRRVGTPAALDFQRVAAKNLAYKGGRSTPLIRRYKCKEMLLGGGRFY